MAIKNIYAVYDNGSLLAKGTIEEIVQRTGIQWHNFKYRDKNRPGFRIDNLGKRESSVPRLYDMPRKIKNSKPVETEYTIISADYENVQVVLLPDGSKRVMSKKTGKLIENETGARRYKKLGSYKKRGVAND